MDETDTKAVVIVILGSVSLVLGLLPLKVGPILQGNGDPRKTILNSSLFCFGGGVLMAVSFLHMIPEVSQEYIPLSSLIFKTLGLE